MVGGTAELNSSILNISVFAGVNRRNTGHVCALCLYFVYQNLFGIFVLSENYNTVWQSRRHSDNFVSGQFLDVKLLYLYHLQRMGLCQELMVSYHTIYSHYLDPYRITKSVWIWK